MSGGEVRKRCVFFLGGYEPITPERQHERFMRELARFERTWNVTTSVSDMSVSGDGAIALWRVETRGPNWSVETEYRSLLWDDMVEADFGRSDWVRVPRAIGAFADFIFSGTAVALFRGQLAVRAVLLLSAPDRRELHCGRGHAGLAGGTPRPAAAAPVRPAGRDPRFLRLAGRCRAAS